MIETLLAAWLSAEAADYDQLVAAGVAAGRAGRLAEALALFDRAVASEPRRPQALVERAGVRFLERQYESAARDLEAALRLVDDAYPRDLLATSLHLTGRTDEALAHWNRGGRPPLRRLTITGLSRTRDRVARREIVLREGAPLTLAALRESRLRLVESGVFPRATVRAIPQGEGQADAEVALLERNGFASGWLDFVSRAAADAAHARARLVYANLGGEGVALGVGYRWERARPEWAVSLRWPRPLGLDANLGLRAFGGRQRYAASAGETRLDRQGAELSLRRAFGPRTVGELGVSVATRRFVPDAGDPGGRTGSLGLALEQGLLENRSVRLWARVEAAGAVGSPRGFGQLGARLKGFWSARPQHEGPGPSVLALQVIGGIASADTPLDATYALGASPEMELPLRGRRLIEGGAFGRAPLARGVLLANLEWRQRIWRKAGLGVVAFCDAARAGRLALGAGTEFRDVGAGLRLDLPGAGALRLDWGHGLTDGRDAVTLGVGNSF